MMPTNKSSSIIWHRITENNGCRWFFLCKGVGRAARQSHIKPRRKERMARPMAASSKNGNLCIYLFEYILVFRGLIELF